MEEHPKVQLTSPTQARGAQPGELPLLVQKFGGSSVADADKLRASAAHALAARQRGHKVVMVVSAMGDGTDDLLQLAATLGRDAANTREMDQLLATGEQVSIAMMAMALRSLGVPAQSLTAAQCGILTDSVHGRATIRQITGGGGRLQSLLAEGSIPVVAGFQGVTEAGDVTTLGRGGSDTTAVALAAHLGGECEIYKDVDGVFTADPRVVPEARLREAVLYDEMLEAASLGSQVIHPRGVELAKKFGVPVRVLHSQRPAGQHRGTVIVGGIGEGEAKMESRVVSSVVLKRNVGRVSIRGLKNTPRVQADVFTPLAEAHVPVDDIMQEDDGPGTINLTFTLDKTDLAQASGIMHKIAPAIGAQAVRIDSGLSTVSAVGAGMRTSSGVAAVMFQALAGDGVLIENITTSEIRISCVVKEQDGEKAVRCIHRAFGLHSPAAEASQAALIHQVSEFPEVKLAAKAIGIS
jgi:aspartate kinase